MKKIYIGYDKKDKKKTDEIFEYFERNGISCFMAPDSIPEDETYATSVPKAIRECDAFFLILSSAVQESSWIPKEIELAIEEKKKIIPFQIEECSINDTYKFYLGNTSIVNGTKKYLENLDEIVLTIKKGNKTKTKDKVEIDKKKETLEAEEPTENKKMKVKEEKSEAKKKNDNVEPKEESKKVEKTEKEENIKPENGIGKYVYPDGNIYEGEWVDGKRCGFGILTMKHIGTLFALFNDDKQGAGILRLNDGNFTNASFDENNEKLNVFLTVEEIIEMRISENKERQFTRKYKNGDEFSGASARFRLQKQGFGIYSYANGEKHIGHWDFGLKNGYGTHYYLNNEVYSGYWSADLKEGLGVQIFKDGNIFFGFFKEGLGFIGIQKDMNGNLYNNITLDPDNSLCISSTEFNEFSFPNGEKVDLSEMFGFGEITGNNGVKLLLGKKTESDSKFSQIYGQTYISNKANIKRKESGENQCPLCHGYGKITKQLTIEEIQGSNHFTSCPKCNGTGKRIN